MKNERKINHVPQYEQAPYKEDGLRPILAGYDPDLDKYEDPANWPEWAKKSHEEANKFLKSTDLSMFMKK